MVNPHLLSAYAFIAITTLSTQVMALPEKSGGLQGYISMNIDKPPSDYGYGVSYYASSWALLEKPLANFQIGLPSTWIIPDNSDFTEPLCPTGTTARDNWPERGPYYQDVFQVMEGGLGFWANTQFLSNIPKFMMNATPDCYTAPMVSSPGWAYGNPTALEPRLMGIAQFSNHLLIPPDGLTFAKASNGELLGVATMALPLNLSSMAGEQSWFVFLNAANFAGPIAFYIPDIWARLSKDYPIIKDRGLDSRSASARGGAMEFNTVPLVEITNNDGVTYSKIPELQFPVKDGRTILMEGIHYYSKDAIYTAFKEAIQNNKPLPTTFNAAGTWSAPCQSNPLSFSQGDTRIPLSGLTEIVDTYASLEQDQCVFGLHWNQISTGMAKFPIYFKDNGASRAVVAPETAPNELASHQFTSAKTSSNYQVLAKDYPVWDNYVSNAFGVKLTDGSLVVYRWYRFVDQPTLNNLHLSSSQKESLQNIVVRLHKTWAIKNGFMPPTPSNTELAALDPALFVTPPAGFEYGYVPIVISQGNWQ